MDDLISRQMAIDALREYKTEPNISDDESEIKGYNDGIDLTISVLSTLPSVQPERKKGKWIYNPPMYDCDQCGAEIYDPSPFCPMCGADMGGD